MIKENILVSHNQIIVRSIPFNNDIQKWTEETLERGILWNKNYVILYINIRYQYLLTQYYRIYTHNNIVS